MNKPRTLPLVCVALLVAGCGGESSPQQSLQAAQTPSQPIDVTVSGLAGAAMTADSVDAWSASYSRARGAMATFNGHNANTSVVALTVAQNGPVILTEASTEYYLSNPYAPLGITGTTNGVPWTFLITSYTPLPSTLAVGESGPYSSGTYYDAAGAAIGSLTQTYTVTAAGPTVLSLNINAAGSLNGVSKAETISYSIAASGAATFNYLQLTVNGMALTFTQ